MNNPNKNRRHRHHLIKIVLGTTVAAMGCNPEAKEQTHIASKVTATDTTPRMDTSQNQGSDLENDTTSGIRDTDWQDTETTPTSTASEIPTDSEGNEEDSTVQTDTGTSHDETDSIDAPLFDSGIQPYATDSDGWSTDSSTDNDDEPDGIALRGAPMLFAPTATGFGLSAVLLYGNPEETTLQIRVSDAPSFEETFPPIVPADMDKPDVARFDVTGLQPETQYDYQLITNADVDAGDPILLYEGSTTTAKSPGSTFNFALISDTHIGSDPDFTNQGDPLIMLDVMELVDAARPDFMVNLGDMLDFHQYGFNSPPPTSDVTKAAYLFYRDLLGHTTGFAPHFAVIGNWEGENGDYTDEAILRSRSTRKRYMPGPTPDTYPQGGSPDEDYYAFEWGDALFIVLNVQTYTTTTHLLDTNGGAPDDWTLGDTQLSWLQETLESATAKWRFIMIHHAVGGAAGTDGNSAYGRGGGQAAHVGEQAIVHQLMIDHNVQIFFYGHDHVFVDMVVDNIHYTSPASAGAIWLFSEYETGYEEAWIEPGWANVTVAPESVNVELINLENRVLHSFTIE